MAFMKRDNTRKKLNRVKKKMGDGVYASNVIRTDLCIETKHMLIDNIDVVEFAIYDETSHRTAIFRLPLVNITFDPNTKQLISQL